MQPNEQPDAEAQRDLGAVQLDVRSGATTTAAWSRTGRVALVYPGILVMLFVLLVAAGVSGSSAGMLSETARDPGLLLGSPQPIRKDEWRIHTPDFLGQIRAGGSSPRLLGVGDHDLSVIGNLPTTDWFAAFRPDNWAASFLAPANALAWNWWLPVLVSALAFYGIAALCGFGPGLSASVSMLISFSPIVEWWHSNAITGSLGFGAAASFSLLMQLRAQSRTRTFVWSISSLYWMVAFALVFYPPFQVSTLLALVPITVAVIAADLRRHRYTWARAIVWMGAVGLAAAIGVAAFVFTHADAIAAIRGTKYPGLRQSTGGSGSFAQLFSADFSPVLAHAQAWFGGTNLSEVSAPYFLAAESLVVILFAGFPTRVSAARNVAIASAGSLALGLTWHQLPIPSSVGRFFLLNLVPPQRVLPLIGISGAFLLAALIHSQIPGLGRRRRLLVGVAVASTSFGLAMIEAGQLRSVLPHLRLPALIAAAGMGALAIAALAAAPRKWGVGAVACLVGFSFLSVNPLYRGTGALEHSAIAQAIRREGTDAIWVSYSDPILESFLSASGASSLSGTNYYPNSEAWTRLLGGMRYERVWNRYLKTEWHDGTNRATIHLFGNALGVIHLSPCAPQLTTFGVTHVLAREGTFAAGDRCLRKIDSVSWKGVRYVIYARSP